jgi:lycopene cyclase domain-containing protein
VIYSDIALNAVFVAVVLDLFLLKSRMMTRGIFWLTYFLILPFQLLTNWWLTSNAIVMYAFSDITGQRIAGAPIEDLLFGFSMILLTISAWEFFVNRTNEKTSINKSEN